MATKGHVEANRLVIQAGLDAAKSSEDRNILGQFATPTLLAQEVAAYAYSLLPMAAKKAVRFLEPAMGTGAFYSALLNATSPSNIEKAVGYEIDPHYGNPAKKIWDDFNIDIRLENFTEASPLDEEQAKFNFLLSNPPYSRHHHIKSGDKAFLQKAAQAVLGERPQGTTGLYAYFMYLCDNWMAEDGIAAWLIPSEFMDVNFGKLLRTYLLDNVTLLRIHRYDPADVQFNDAVVSSAVVLLQKRTPQSTDAIEFTYGGTLSDPATNKRVTAAELRELRKWNTIFKKVQPVRNTGAFVLSDFFSVKRGLATGCNEFFILTEEQAEQLQLPSQFLRPVLPSPKSLKIEEIEASPTGRPTITTPVLLSCDLPREAVKANYPALHAYLLEGEKLKPSKKNPEKLESISQGYLCANRKVWYWQENRPAAPFICTYMGKSNETSPFRFILNRSNATTTNSYLMLYPKPALQTIFEKDQGALYRVWEALLNIHPDSMIDEGRVYGGGLHKLEPKELANVPVPDLELLASGQTEKRAKPVQMTLELG